MPGNYRFAIGWVKNYLCLIIKTAMKIFLITLSMILSASVYTSAQDTIPEEPVTGACERSDLLTGEFGSYYDEYYHDYRPDKKVVRQLTGAIGDFEIVIVLGTWCHDSKEQVPRFFRILDESGFMMEGLKMICVDRDKEVPGEDISDLNIERVPTFIVYHNGKESGRIVETPTESLEEDLLLLVKE